MASFQQKPSWEVLVLLSQTLDPKTLAISSCVSRTWSHAMSSDHLWTHICAAEFPSLSSIPSAVSRRRLYSLCRAAAARRTRAPQKPRIALSDLLFAVSISAGSSSPLFSVLVKPRADGEAGGGVFVFDVADGGSAGAAVVEGGGAVAEVKAAWSVVARGWRGVFTMMECEGKVGVAAGAEGWFSAELPGPGCCCAGPAGAGSGVVADLKVGFGRCNNNNNSASVRVDRVSVGILNVVSWRYVTVEDGLRYLQHFLPSSSSF